jgi:catechol 2,3-dioxygenase-like lactoylglutathione lyase family enzyme
MRQFSLAVILFLSSARAGVAQQESIPRPPIYGISHVRFHVTEPQTSLSFYEKTLGLPPDSQLCISSLFKCFRVNSQQFVKLDPAETRLPHNFLQEIGFATSDVSMMRKFLLGRGVKLLPVSKSKSFPSVGVSDPEGNWIIFEQVPKIEVPAGDRQMNASLIHAGFVVHDRAADDRFYKDILGFHVYWHGGMKDGEDNWVDMQVPDGSDWIEYMLGVSPDASRKTLGVMNHIALGVPDIHAAQQQLIKNGWKGTEEPKIGRDGKWQLNLYDPDETRVELMEFKPTKEPCCSAYTGPHPGPAQ